jgi:hypothetical protein
MVIGAIAMVITLGSTVSDGFDLDGPSPVAIDKPDVDQILAREQKQIEAEKQRKLERREARAERRTRPKKPRRKKGGDKKPQAPRAAGARAGQPAAASTPSAPAPSPPPAPAAPEPAPAPAPEPAQSGPVDPRFY